MIFFFCLPFNKTGEEAAAGHGTLSELLLLLLDSHHN
jgi:hypothetical protein